MTNELKITFYNSDNEVVTGFAHRKLSSSYQATLTTGQTVLIPFTSIIDTQETGIKIVK